MEIKNNDIIDKKTLNVSFNVSGSGSLNTRISLPITWVRDNLKLSKENRKIEAILIDGMIVIKPKSQV